jgi:hypothetical protein
VLKLGGTVEAVADIHVKVRSTTSLGRRTGISTMSSADITPAGKGHLAEAADSSGLPRPEGRWNPTRKALVVAALNRGLIDFESACARYALSAEELDSWRRGIGLGGGKHLAARISRPGRRRRDGWEA